MLVAMRRTRHTKRYCLHVSVEVGGCERVLLSKNDVVLGAVLDILLLLRGVSVLYGNEAAHICANFDLIVKLFHGYRRTSRGQSRRPRGDRKRAVLYDCNAILPDFPVSFGRESLPATMRLLVQKLGCEVQSGSRDIVVGASVRWVDLEAYPLLPAVDVSE